MIVTSYTLYMQSVHNKINLIINIYFGGIIYYYRAMINI